MPPPIDLDDDLENADDNYHESSDEDFNPEGAPADESGSSDDEEQAPGKATKGAAKGKGKGKRKAAADDGLDSGDEVTIEAARKRKSKKRKGGKTDDDDDLLLSDDEGDEGGLIKTRAQRRTEQKERKPLARTDGATVDVDALWAQMMAAPLIPLSQTKTETADESKGLDVAAGGAVASAAQEEEEQVTVKKVYTFAGQRTEEEKQIPRSSLDQYISDGWKAVDAPGQTEDADGKTREGDKDTGPKIRRPLRRPSRFDPNPIGYVRALPPEFQLTWPRKGAAAAPAGQENVPAAEAPKTKLEKAQKLNVVDKSRLDWTGFVDKEGIADELDTHGKTKEAYLGRMQFLAGVEARREEERRKAKSSATAS